MSGLDSARAECRSMGRDLGTEAATPDDNGATGARRGDIVAPTTTVPHDRVGGRQFAGRLH